MRSCKNSYHPGSQVLNGMNYPLEKKLFFAFLFWGAHVNKNISCVSCTDPHSPASLFLKFSPQIPATVNPELKILLLSDAHVNCCIWRIGSLDGTTSTLHSPSHGKLLAAPDLQETKRDLRSHLCSPRQLVRYSCAGKGASTTWQEALLSMQKMAIKEMPILFFFN